jgi:hypothetical protein
MNETRPVYTDEHPAINETDNIGYKRFIQLYVRKVDDEIPFLRVFPGFSSGYHNIILEQALEEFKIPINYKKCKKTNINFVKPTGINYRAVGMGNIDKGIHSISFRGFSKDYMLYPDITHFKKIAPELKKLFPNNLLFMKIKNSELYSSI